MLGKMIWRFTVLAGNLFFLLLDSALCQEEPFVGSISWQGTVNHNSNPWVWTQGQSTQPISLRAQDAERANGQYIWKGLLDHSALLTGKTVRLLPTGRVGIEPLVQYGGEDGVVMVEWVGDGVASITVPARGGGDERKMQGRLSFSIRAAQTMVATHLGQRQWFNLYAPEGKSAAGNGLPPRAKTLSLAGVSDLQHNLSGQIPEHFSTASKQHRAGGELARSQMRNPDMLAVGGVYSAVIIGGSGRMWFPESTLPKSWNAIIPITVTYK